MIEIRYREQFDISDLAGQTVNEARNKFKTEFDIPDKAKAKLNGKFIKANLDTHGQARGSWLLKLRLDETVLTFISFHR
jgi:hypothetical protein